MEINTDTAFGQPLSPTMFDPPAEIVTEVTPEIVETPEVEVAPEVTPEVVETPVETPVEIPKTEEATEEKPEEVVEAKTEEVAEVKEPIVFDTESPELLAKIDEALDKYELPEEVSAVITALKVKAETPAQDFTAYADYGDAEAIKSLLDRQAYLDSVTETEPGQYRPNTDKFADEIQKTSPDKASWLYFDLAKLPSDKYQGLNKFEEGIADALAMEGDTVQSVISRYQQTINAVKTGAVLTNNAPEFIPPQLQEAYWSLSKREREELESFDPSLDRIEYDENGRAVNQDEPIRLEKLQTLAKVQKGIDGDKVNAQREQQTIQSRQQELQTEINTTQVKFYDAFRESVTQDVLKNVKFSDDPKMQAILAHQNVAFLSQALSDDAAGENARQVLIDSGIKFDKTTAMQLQKDIEAATVSLIQAKKTVDAQGNPLNPIELNKATSQFKRVTTAWQAFAKDILDQEARLVSTGKAEDVKAEVAKIKVAPKARVAPKGVPTIAQKDETLPRYKSQEWYARIAERELEAEQRRAQAYA